MKSRFFVALVCLSILHLFTNFSALGNNKEIELKISLNTLLNPKTRTELWLHFVNHTGNQITGRSFSNGNVTALFLVKSSGKYFSCSRFFSQNQLRRGRFFIHPGDASGYIVNINEFRLTRSGLFYLVFAIPDPLSSGFLLSKPFKMVVADDRSIQDASEISEKELPIPVKSKLKETIEAFLKRERFPKNQINLPY